MKLVSIAVALAAATSVVAMPQEMEKWCYLPGQGCKRAADSSAEVKRHAEALAEAMPQEMEKWCYLPGQGCNKMKRAAEAITEVKRSADALAEAMADADK
ncbi:hypothetical protein PHISP_02495 [Aspergillus sp. HF37]|nr:hypothetical protein PHISP_02495 [Aspergillus sp. HF37]